MQFNHRDTEDTEDEIELRQPQQRFLSVLGVSVVHFYNNITV